MLLLYVPYSFIHYCLTRGAVMRDNNNNNKPILNTTCSDMLSSAKFQKVKRSYTPEITRDDALAVNHMRSADK